MEKFSDAVVALLLAVISGLFGGLVWLLKLDAKVNQTVDDVERLEKRADESDQKQDLMLEQLSDIREMTAEIRGVIRNKLDH